MNRLPPYLAAQKRRGGAAGPSQTRKRAASEGAGAERATSQATSSKKSKSTGAGDSLPSLSPAAETVPARTEVETVMVEPQPEDHHEESSQPTVDHVPDLPTPPPPPPPAAKLPRSFAWDRGVTEELSTVFFPPRRLLDSAIPLNDADHTMLKAIQDYLLKGVGITQAVPHLKHQLVQATAAKRRSDADRDLALASQKKLEEELSNAQASEAKVAKELATARASAESVASEMAGVRASAEVTAQELSVARKELALSKEELARVQAELKAEKSAHSLAIDAVKSLQSQRTKLTEELSTIGAELAYTKESLAINDMAVTTAAKDAFDMTLAQVKYWNKDVALDLSRCHHLAYVLDGEFFPADAEASASGTVSTPGPDASDKGGDGEAGTPAETVDPPVPPPSES